MTDDPPPHLAVALDGAGWHPAAWRGLEAPPDQLLTAAYWGGQATEAERGLLDFVTIEDSPGLDGVLAAGWIAPATSHIGLVPAATVSHTEPFRVSKAIAGLDDASLGRAGWRPQLSRPWPGSPATAARRRASCH
jgi:alkanesulfonate monooxygenase SsuD/methylene tetrahydromethanopterin reductase-like flavin-dependent oxidoreductase (luciferase family)